MTDDPVVLILREAAARGRQLRLAREQAMQNETRSEGNVIKALRSDQVVGVAVTP
jgi:hypothetical protein